MTLTTTAQSTSELCKELQALRPSVLQLFKITDGVIRVIEVVVELCALYLRHEGDRPFFTTASEFLNERTNGIESDEIIAAIKDSLAALDSPQSGLVNRLKSTGFVGFVERLLGAGSFRRMQIALQHDGQIVVKAVRKALDSLRPLILALDEASAILPSSKRVFDERLTFFESGMLRASFALDRELGNSFLKWMGIDESELEVIPEVRDRDLSRTIDALRCVIASDTIKRVSRIETQFANKINGARWALSESEDGVSQAANSLVELIDRLLRLGHTNEDVVAWTTKLSSYRFDDLVYTDPRTDRQKATKKAEALYFIYGGQVPANEMGPSPLLVMIAESLVAARRKLEKIKHADTGSDADRQMVHELLVGVEGAIAIALRCNLARKMPQDN